MSDLKAKMHEIRFPQGGLLLRGGWGKEDENGRGGEREGRGGDRPPNILA